MIRTPCMLLRTGYRSGVTKNLHTKRFEGNWGNSMNSQEAKQYLESQSNVVMGMILEQSWEQLQSWFLETIQTVGLNEYAQPLAEEARQFFERMSLFHQGNMPKEEAQTLVHEENLHLVDLLEERERGAKMLQGVKSLRMKYRKKSLQDVSTWLTHFIQNLGINVTPDQMQNYVTPAMAGLVGSALVAAGYKIYERIKKEGKGGKKSL